MVFALPLIKFTLTNKFMLVYQDSYAKEFYLDKQLSTHQTGLAKTKSTANPPKENYL
jgi:hypothetical protein